MKKVLKSLIALSLGLALVATGCKKDDDNLDLSGVVGSYPITVDIAALGITELPAMLVVTANGNDLKATGTVTVPAQVNPLIGSLTIDLALTSLKEFSGTLGEISIPITDAFLFKVASQNITVLGQPFPFAGTNEINGYDGIIGKFVTFPIIGFSIQSEDIPQVGILKIEVGSVIG